MDRSRNLNQDLGLRSGPLGQLFRSVLAWPALLLSGLSPALTGQLDWNGLYGERAVSAAALGTAGYVLWWLGERTRAERYTCWATLAFSMLALGLFPAGSRLQFAAGIWLIHIGLCWQLLAWAGAARKTQARGLYIMWLGMMFETFVDIPAAQLIGMDAVCDTGTRLACLYGGYVTIALPAAITAALIICWLNPMVERARGRGR